MTNLKSIIPNLRRYNRGDKIYCTTLGTLTFLELREEEKYPIVCKHEDIAYPIVFLPDGRMSERGEECILFPSKFVRKWGSINNTVFIVKQSNNNPALFYEKPIKTNGTWKTEISSGCSTPMKIISSMIEDITPKNILKINFEYIL